MRADKRTRFGRRLEALTAIFLEQVEECVQLLPELVSRYIEGGDYRTVADRIGTRESDCDRTCREVSSLVSTASSEDFGIRLTGIYLNRGQLLGLYGQVDDISNATEQFATDLIAIEPERRQPCLDGLQKMATHAALAAQYLREAVTDFLRKLCRPDYTVPVTESVAAIRRLESEADDIRKVTVRTAFGSKPDVLSLVYRELAMLLDDVLDRIEDVTDGMHRIAGDGSWVGIESPDTEPVE